MGAVCLGLGLFWGDLMALGGGETSSGLGFTCMGIVFPLMGGLLLWAGYRLSATIIRVSMAEGEVTLDWRNERRVVKRERVLLSDVVEVVVTDNPSSGGTSMYGLALGMKNGEIVLSNTNSSDLEQHYVRECRRLAEFLNVPSRTPT
jgi:hypothetical protein